jgi:very-short-patch-repair endonuclease
MFPFWGNGNIPRRVRAGSVGMFPSLWGGPIARSLRSRPTQRALITRGQLSGLGLGPSAIEHALRRGRLHRVHQGLYSMVPFAVLPPLAVELAAVLACGDRALLSHHSAAAAWALRPSFNGDVHVTVIAKDTGRRRPGIRVHRISELDPRDIRRYQNIPITSPARTILEIAPDLTDRELERALDEALIQRLVSHAALNAAIAAYRNRRGVARLRALPDPGRTTTATRSDGEEALLAALRRANIPAPEVNGRVANYTADFVWRKEKVIVEVDGYDYHRGRAAFERDHERDAEHLRLGFLVIRVTGRQLARDLEALLVQIAAALALRAAAA